MKIYKILIIATLLSSPFTVSAHDNQYYTSLTGEYIFDAKGEGSLTSGDFSVPGNIGYKNHNLGGLGAIGYYFNPHFRTEIEGGYRHLKAHSITLEGESINYSQSTDLYSLMGNAYYDIATYNKFTPYIGAGLGLVHKDDNAGNGNALGYQGLVGVNYEVSNNSSIFLGYRYFATSNFKDNYNIGTIPVSQKGNIDSNSIDIGYRYSF